MVGCPRHYRRQAMARASGSLVVVVPAYGDAEQLRTLLGDLQRQDDAGFEILIVDDGSPKPIEPQIADLLRAGPIRSRCERTPNAGGPGARNNGARLAGDAETLLFLDQDMRIPPGFVGILQRTLAEVGPAALSADFVYRLVDDGSPFARWYLGHARAWEGAPQERWTERAPGVFAVHPVNLTSTNLCIPRALFDSVGGFPVFPIAGTEDQALGLLLGQRGAAVLRTTRTSAEHVEHRVTFERFCARQRMGMTGTVTLLRRFPEVFGALAESSTHEVNGPWSARDPLPLQARKLVKAVLSRPGIQPLGMRAVRWLEENAPHTRALHHAYELVLGAHLQAAWRHGLTSDRLS